MYFSTMIEPFVDSRFSIDTDTKGIDGRYVIGSCRLCQMKGGGDANLVIREVFRESIILSYFIWDKYGYPFCYTRSTGDLNNSFSMSFMCN